MQYVRLLSLQHLKKKIKGKKKRWARGICHLPHVQMILANSKFLA